MKQVNMHEAKTELSKLVDRAEAGEEIVIAPAGKPAAKLVPLTKSRGHRRLGLLDGKFQIPDDFNAPLPDSVIRAFEPEAVRLLLDTHLLLWAAASSKRLPREARELMEDDSNDVYYSAASIWKSAIKRSLRRKDFRIDLPQLLAALPEMGLVELPITAAHAASVTGVPPMHRDPFDRRLIA